MNTRNYKTISFAIANSNFNYYSSTLAEINKFIKLKKKVPYSLIENYFLIQLPIDYVKTDETSADIRLAASKAYEYFKPTTNPGYNFEGKKKVKDGTKNSLITYSQNDLFFLCASSYYKLKDDDKIKENKDDILRFFYKEIRRYRDEMFSKRHEAKLKHYKLAVLATYLTYAVGFKVCNKKNFTNRDLFQSSKYALKKLSKSSKVYN